jgi:hypothetical protein
MLDGDQDPRDEVDQDPAATGEREDHERDPHQNGIDPEVPPEPSADAADHAVVAGAAQQTRPLSV